MKPPRKARIWILVGLCIFAGLLWGANWYFVSKFAGDEAKQGQFGDMFGAVNALFTALAFAGLIYTVLLQRDQLALQQKEIIESGETQKLLVAQQIEAQRQLFEQQKTFQNEQRSLQEQHALKLEQLRQDFGEIVENRRKDRQREQEIGFQRNVLRAIRCELESLGTIYASDIGATVSRLVDGQILETRLALSQDWFTVFTANAAHLGRIDQPETSRHIVGVYALLKGLIEEFRINNDYLIQRAQVEFEIRQREGELHLKEKKKTVEGWLVGQAIRIKQSS